MTRVSSIAGLALLCTLALLSTIAQAQPPADYQQVKLDAHTFTLPLGFSIERVAGPAGASRPITADFDERGRLYVADSSGSNEKVQVQLENPTHRIVRLEDADGDGRYEQSTVFADKLMFPEGTLWHDGSLYVAAPPHIWKLTDTDDDGRADRREVWFDGKTLTGCANDLHGPYLGPDGWIYWAKGAFARQSYTLPNGQEWSTRASHIFRARPDASGIEPVMTGGMDNPVDVVFTTGGERILTNTFLQHPAAGLRDGLLHAVYGGIYGKDHDPLYEPQHKWTSPHLMPVLTHMGPAAPCGLVRLESSELGDAFEGNLFACQFNLRKVSRHVLRASGSTFTTEDSDFLTSDNSDFHPTDVLEDADGSLLVVDTGGWYKLCCPSSQLIKADVLGAIYRIRREGAHRASDPRGLSIDWDSLTPTALAKLLADERPAVRQHAILRLRKLGDDGLHAVTPLFESRESSPAAARGAIAVACRIEGEGARQLVRAALQHADESVRQLAIHAASVWRDRSAVDQLVPLLAAPSLANRRAVAEALGRIGGARAVPAILAALADAKSDRVLDHSLTYALIEIGETEPLRSAMTHENRRVRRAALAAVDQLGGAVDPDIVIGSLTDADEPLRDTARWIAGRHPEWDERLVEHLSARLAAPPRGDEASQLSHLLAKLSKAQAVEKLIAEAARDAGEAPEAARLALAAMAASGRKELPPPWTDAILDLLHADSPVLADALAVLRAVPAGKEEATRLNAALAAVAEGPLPAELRLAALSAMAGGLTSVSPAQFELLIDNVDRQEPAALRGSAAGVLSTARLSQPQLLRLAEKLPECSPLELERLLDPFAESADEQVGLALIAALSQPALRASITVDALRRRLAKQSERVQTEANKLYVAIDAEHARQAARLEEVLGALPMGDIRRGQEVFNSSQVACRACHTIGYVGGRIGPDLTRIGQVRTDRDLLESILYPSSSFVRSFEPLLVRTHDGQVLSGVVKSEGPEEIVLTLAADKEVRIAREEVEAAQPGKVSVMPAGLDKQLSPQQIGDLIAFLRSCR